MRAHIEQYAQAVLGSYGASDLEINLGIETPFSVALRRAIAASPELSGALTKQGEYGVLPMIFQFNPFGYLIETNDLGELVVTITRSENISPRIRYNIHDRGHVVRMRSLQQTLRAHGFDELADSAELDLPLLFHYGRSDLSVDYNGAVVAPDVVRDVVYGDPGLLEAVENHRLISYEDDRGDRQLHIAFQLASGADDFDAAAARPAVVSELRRLNKDFSNAIRRHPRGPCRRSRSTRTGRGRSVTTGGSSRTSTCGSSVPVPWPRGTSTCPGPRRRRPEPRCRRGRGRCRCRAPRFHDSDPALPRTVRRGFGGCSLGARFPTRCEPDRVAPRVQPRTETRAARTVRDADGSGTGHRAPASRARVRAPHAVSGTAAASRTGPGGVVPRRSS